MNMIDVHTHIFPTIHGMNAAGPTRDAGYGRMRIGEQQSQLLPPLNEQTCHTPEMLIASLDWAGVDRAVLLQGPFYGECNEYVSAALARYPHRLSGAAYVDPWDESGRRMFDACTAIGRFKIVKLEFSDGSGYCGFHRDARLDDASAAWLWPRMAQHNLTLTLDLGEPGDRSYQTSAVRQIARGNPDLKIVIAHLAQPRSSVERDPERWQLWLEQIDLGRLPNVWFDNAALPAYYQHEGYPFPGAARMIRLAVERIGPSKVMFGTDAPGLLSVATYKQLVTVGRQHVQFLSPADQELVLSRNAQFVYDIK
jgi:predicted TIM-barrel fold metal-dependent hydrolase